MDACKVRTEARACSFQSGVMTSATSFEHVSACQARLGSSGRPLPSVWRTSSHAAGVRDFCTNRESHCHTSYCHGAGMGTRSRCTKPSRRPTPSKQLDDDRTIPSTKADQSASLS